MHSYSINTRVAISVIAIHCGMLVWQTFQDAPTVDETAYLPGGISAWHFGRFDLCYGNPPLVRMIAALPVLVARPQTDWSRYTVSEAQHAVGRDFVTANGARAFFLFALARLAVMPFSVLGAFICYRWSHELYGHRAALISITLWCLCPNTLGHGHLITCDVPLMATTVGASYQAWRWLRSFTWTDAMVCGCLTGLAQLTKIIAVVMYGYLVVWWALFALERILSTSHNRDSVSRASDSDCPPWLSWNRTWLGARLLSQLALVLLLSVATINIGYGCQGCFWPIRDFHFRSKLLNGNTSDQTVPGNRFWGTAVANLRVPLPSRYIDAIDAQSSVVEDNHRSYLRGRWQDTGWWYYYIYGLLVKLPLGAILLTVVGFTCDCVKLRTTQWRDAVVLWLPVASIGGLVSGLTGLNAHLRYIFPILPFLWIAASQIVEMRLAAKWNTLLGVILVVWSSASSLFIFPHSISYFNELVGGPLNGYRHLDNSNIDWGQDLLRLATWSENQGANKPLQLVYFGNVDPRVAGIEFSLPTSLLSDFARHDDNCRSIAYKPGLYAISANFLAGRGGTHVFDEYGGRQFVAEERFNEFSHATPRCTVGYSIYIFELH